MLNINNFSPPKKNGLITICEKNSILISVNPKEENDLIKVFPDEYFSSDRIKDSKIQPSEYSSGFLRNQMPFHIKLLSGWYNHGFLEFLNILSNMEYNLTITKAISNLAKCGLKISNFFSTNSSQSNLTNDFSTTIDRQSSLIQSLAWHPQSQYLAIVSKNDCIKIRKYDSLEETKLLHHAQQYKISNVAWRPMHFMLAVACDNGIILWDLEVKKIITSLTLSDPKILKHEDHSPVSCVSWQPCGTLLASSSKNSSTIMIWKVEMETFSPLRRLHFDGSPFISWSPNGARIFSASMSSKLRIWNTQTMMSDSWLKVNKRCQASCWSPDSRILLFASSDVPVIYSITFKYSSRGLEEEGQIVPVINVSQGTCCVEGLLMRVGGLVESMEWDEHGERLAVLFQLDSSPSYIALYHTRYLPKFSAVPIGLIIGLTEECAIHMKFMPNFESGSLLSIAWSSGRLSHIPLYYSPSVNLSSPLFSLQINNVKDNFSNCKHF